MKRLLPLLSAVALAGCSLGASLTGDLPPPMIYPAGFAGEGSMLLCRMHSTDECVRTEVVTDGAVVTRILGLDGEWLRVKESECRDGHCYAKDENDVEWKLEP